MKLFVMQDDIEGDTKDNHGHLLLSYATKHGYESLLHNAIVKLLLWHHPEHLAIDVTHQSGVISRHKVT